MKLPNLENAVVPEAKITRYLLSLTHEDGYGKAIFFLEHGFSVDKWEDMVAALLQHAADHDVVKIVPTRFGSNYVIEGTMQLPDKQAGFVRAVWFIEVDGIIPKLATAYPIKEHEND